MFTASLVKFQSPIGFSNVNEFSIFSNWFGLGLKQFFGLSDETDPIHNNDTMTNYISKPVLDSKSGDFVWDGFQVNPIPGKGLGVVTTRAFGKRFIGYRLPYGGIVINSSKEYDYLSKNAGRKFEGYQHGHLDFVIEGNAVKDEVVSWLDAHPRRYLPEMPKNAWLGSLVNEPSIGQRYNCHYEILPGTQRRHCPDYEYLNRDVIGVVVIDKVLKKGEELCISYYGNNSKRVYKRLGFQHIPSGDGDKEEEAETTAVPINAVTVGEICDRQEIGRNLAAWNKANLLPNGKRRRNHR